MKQKNSIFMCSLFNLCGCAALLGGAACGGQRTEVVGGPKRDPVLMQDITLQNALNFPSGQEFLEAAGHGIPPEGEKDQEVRRRVSENSAVIDAQQKLIKQLEPLVPRNKIRDILRQSQVGTVQFLYDDACNLTLRIPKEAVVGKAPIQ